MTLRLRLTLLYGSVFIAAGAGLLATTYALFKHNQSGGSTAVAFKGANFKLPSGARIAGFVPAGGRGGALFQISTKPRTGVTATPGSGQATQTTVSGSGHGTPPAVIQQIKNSGQRQLNTLARRAIVELKAEQSNDASSLLQWSAIAFGVVALLSIGLAWWLSGRALRPLRTMNARAREISAENLHERLGVEGRGDELGELAATFDALLTRLEAAFESQRRFVANASHELRTPITLERTLVEVALADPDVSVDVLRQVCERVVASTEEQERLLDALLTLARSEGGIATGDGRWRSGAPRAPDRQPPGQCDRPQRRRAPLAQAVDR